MSKPELRRPLVALLIAPDPAMWTDVITGRKRITIREGRRDYRPGDTVMLCCDLCNIAVMAKIETVQHKTLREVTQEEWEADGFANQEDLLNGMKTYYENLTWDSPVTVVTWDDLIRGSVLDDVRQYGQAIERAAEATIRRQQK